MFSNEKGTIGAEMSRMFHELDLHLIWNPIILLRKVITEMETPDMMIDDFIFVVRSHISHRPPFGFEC